MCGILGTIPSSNGTEFKNALNRLEHRGPDGFGIETIENSITLGHRRLAIVDLSNDAHQPMYDKTKRYCVIFNGEIYNFLEIKKELEVKGHTFCSSSDTEVLLYSYIEWGEECVLKFNGMWAFAIWDSQKKELFLSRDRFGKKPLFYAMTDGKFIFASEMKAIYPFLKEIRPSQDFHWMKNNIFSYEATEKCLIDGIKRFPFGHNGIYKNGNLVTKRYWNTLDNIVDPPKTYDAQVERFRELFLDACKIRMRADVPIGTALSGGLDSSATISAMAHLSKSNVDYGKNDWQHAFVASFPGTPLDESHFAKMVVDHIGIEATYINIEPLKYWDNLEKYFYMFEDLYITSPIPMMATYGAVKKYGTTVTLDGHGADELFSGYGHLVEALWNSKFSIKNSIDILNTYQETLGNGTQFDRNSNFNIYVKFMIKKIAKIFFGKEIRSKDANHKNFKKLDSFSQQLYIIFHETILPTLLRNYDRYSMTNSVEIRMPFMDHRIVSFVTSLPYSSKFGNGYTKKLIRDAMDPYMPKEITWRKSKVGFNSPIVDWMQGDLKEWFLDTVHEKGFMESSLIDNPPELQRQISNIANKNTNSYVLAENSWKNLTPYIWEKAIKKFGAGNNATK
ncbi:asparagine synthase (glutamine-hydrolyzing) [Campylobacter concisus]|uniref:asparagine synthase (glutamine-hydrolyzing) n=1 Tax=Campylobacter concisus TaxID=199 RepID=UPI000D328390|nr:asparagine synthase (glutamine-hydrolyzing) [Campylobacter concisus]